jgi:hypothetical protein
MNLELLGALRPDRARKADKSVRFDEIDLSAAGQQVRFIGNRAAKSFVIGKKLCNGQFIDTFRQLTFAAFCIGAAGLGGPLKQIP